MKNNRFSRVISTFLAVLMLLVLHVPVAAEELNAIFADGKPRLNLRYRFESVDDNALQANGQTLQQAHASTLRALFGYQTGSFHGLSATLDFESVIGIGAESYNDGSNGKSRFATVVDPTGTELEQLHLHYEGLQDTSIKLGRQYITYRTAPHHRFIGTILWRQNWQNHDALTIRNTFLPTTTLNYAYTWRVNRIFGNDAPEPLSHFDSNSHLFNIQHKIDAIGDLEAYAYLLDFNNAAAFSTQTYGASIDGEHNLNSNYSLIYTLEYARQYDYKNNNLDIDADYLMGAVGVAVRPDNDVIDMFQLKLAYELLSGEGGADRFVTILGTNHAFQGWADRFLITPGDGIRDIYGSLAMDVAGFSFIAEYHEFSSDNDSYDYGTELDLLLNRKLRHGLSAQLKYAHYDADANVVNANRNPVLAANKSIFWALAQYQY
ncbi:MAG: hypothetical protein RLT87_12310 [Gammaproteobacteria bacterium]